MKKFPIIGTILAAFVASLCCLGPALLAAVGLGSLGISALLAKSHWFLFALGLAILGAGLYWLLKQKSEEGCCEVSPQAPNRALKTISLVVLSGILFFALKNGLTHQVAPWLYGKKHTPTSPAQTTTASTRIASLSISGMTCILCTRGIEAHLKEIPGIYNAEVSFDQKNALVCFNPHELSPQDLERHIQETGYSGKIISEKACSKPGSVNANL